VVAQLVLDGHVFAGVARADSEWNLVMHDGIAAGASDLSSIWAIVQAIASRAEVNGSLVSLQRDSSLTPLLEQFDRAELDSPDLADLVDKILTVYPLPDAPSAGAGTGGGVSSQVLVSDVLDAEPSGQAP